MKRISAGQRRKLSPTVSPRSISSTRDASSPKVFVSMRAQPTPAAPAPTMITSSWGSAPAAESPVGMAGGGAWLSAIDTSSLTSPCTSTSGQASEQASKWQYYEVETPRYISHTLVTDLQVLDLALGLLALGVQPRRQHERPHRLLEQRLLGHLVGLDHSVQRRVQQCAAAREGGACHERQTPESTLRHRRRLIKLLVLEQLL